MKISDLIPSKNRIPPPAVLLPALFLYNCFEFSSWIQLGQVSTRPWLPLVWIYGLAGLLPLAFRDRAPVVVFAVQCAHTAAAWPIMSHYIPVVGIPVALYAVSARRSKEVSLLALLVSAIPSGLTVMAAFWIYTSTGEAVRASIVNATFIVSATIGAWGAGRLTQASQQRVQQLERDQRTVEEAAQKAVTDAQKAVTEERRRIAQELHDTISHAVTGILLQAAVASGRTPESHVQIKEPLTNIEIMAKRAMAELRRLLGVLDSTDHAAGIGELKPQPGLADLPTLLNEMRTIGMTVTIHEEGTPCDLDPSVDLAAYRIMKEGLANILKHAAADRDPQLRLSWGTHSLVIQIDNGGGLAETPREQVLLGGRGLVGLRERAHAVGGHFRAGPHSEVGYRLLAKLPFAAPAVPQEVSSTIRSCSCTGPRGIKEKHEHDPSRGCR